MLTRTSIFTRIRMMLIWFCKERLRPGFGWFLWGHSSIHQKLRLTLQTGIPKVFMQRSGSTRYIRKSHTMMQRSLAHRQQTQQKRKAKGDLHRAAKPSVMKNIKRWRSKKRLSPSESAASITIGLRRKQKRNNKMFLLRILSLRAK